MLTRLYIDNYKCFSNFELTLGPLQLLLGDNGTGKSSVLDVVAGLQKLLCGDPIAESGLGGATLTRWDRRSRQTFELDAQPPGMPELKYRLELEVDPDRYRGATTVAHEALMSGGVTVYSHDGTTATLLESDGEVTRGFVPRGHSGVALSPGRVAGMDELQDLMRRLVVLRPWPSGMIAASMDEDARLARDGSNFSAWYRGLRSTQQQQAQQSFYRQLTEVLSGFVSLHFSKTGEKERVLKTQWRMDAGESSSSFEIAFDELSDGQRMLVLLYALLSLSVDGPPLTILLDEPTNFVSLAEVEPWLGELAERSEEGRLQAIVVSHNPEVLNAWARGHGIRFSRDAAGPVRTKRFTTRDDDPLTPAERIARGWDDEDA